MKDENDLNAMIQLSDVELKETKDTFWFSRANQKVLVYQLAKELFINDDITPDEAITQAEDFVNTFFVRKIKW